MIGKQFFQGIVQAFMFDKQAVTIAQKTVAGGVTAYGTPATFVHARKRYPEVEVFGTLVLGDNTQTQFDVSPTGSEGFTPEVGDKIVDADGLTWFVVASFTSAARALLKLLCKRGS